MKAKAGEPGLEPGWPGEAGWLHTAGHTCNRTSQEVEGPHTEMSFAPPLSSNSTADVSLELGLCVDHGF